MSDGSDRLVFRDTETFAVVRSVRVRDGRGSVDQLNELECVDGMVWANVWQTDRIVRIDPRDGRVTGIVDALNRLIRATTRIVNSGEGGDIFDAALDDPHQITSMPNAVPQWLAGQAGL